MELTTRRKAAIVIICICLIVFLAIYFGVIKSGFIGGTIRSGPGLDYDLNSELTELRKIQEQNLRNIAYSK